MSSLKVYGGVMPKYLAKLSKFGGQYRVTIPRALIEEMAWEKVEYVILDPEYYKSITIREFIDEKSLGIKRKEDPSGSD